MLKDREPVIRIIPGDHGTVHIRTGTNIEPELVYGNLSHAARDLGSAAAAGFELEDIIETPPPDNGYKINRPLHRGTEKPFKNKK